MRKLSLFALASVALAGCRDGTMMGPELPSKADRLPAQDQPTSYIVGLRGIASASDSRVMSDIVMASDARVEHVYTNVLNGFSAVMSSQAAEVLRARADVAFVEADGIVSIVGTQTPAPWNLDRLDQASLPLNNAYSTTTSGAGVNVYILDTGIRTSHHEFGGRAVGAFSAIPGGTEDCNGHGTHVAGTVGGSTWGVAKNVKLYAVRVMECNGTGRTSGVIAGIDWITTHAVKPAVANMSLGGGLSFALDAAVANSIASGVTYAIAAGNSSADACWESPGRVPTALTIAATAANDYRASFSNVGTCVDLFAPGVDVTSAWIGSDDAAISASGTSMATPHAAGVAALYLENHPAALPAEVANALIAAAGVDNVFDAAGSPNRMLSTVRAAGAPPPQPPPAAPAPPPDLPPVANFSASCFAVTCTLNASASTDDGQIVSYNWSMPGAAIGTAVGPAATAVYSTAGAKSITLTVTDNIGQSTSLTQSVSISAINQPPLAQFAFACTNLSCAVDASNSTDDNGITSYLWTWSNGDENGTGSGQSTVLTFPHSGSYNVVLTVRDAGGLTNSLTKVITATAPPVNRLPTAQITAPTNGSVANVGARIGFRGTGNDPEDGALANGSLVWTSSIDGFMGIGTAVDTKALSVGTHNITLTARDAANATAVSTITIRIVVSVNTAPSASITSPSNNESALQGTLIAFNGAGSDVEDGALAGASLVWTSSINGAIGTGASFWSSALSVGVHTITLTVKDAQNATATATRTLTITVPAGNAPSTKIQSPDANLTVVQGTTVSMRGYSHDPDEGYLQGGSLVWRSNRDGVLGSGSSISVSSLSVGAHIISLTATDFEGLAGSASTMITVTSNGAPPVEVPPATVPPVEPPPVTPPPVETPPVTPPPVTPPPVETPPVTPPPVTPPPVQTPPVTPPPVTPPPVQTPPVTPPPVTPPPVEAPPVTPPPVTPPPVQTPPVTPPPVTPPPVETPPVTPPPVETPPVTPPPAPTPPAPTFVADFVWECPKSDDPTLWCVFDASASHDGIGITRYQWNMGDGRVLSTTSAKKTVTYPKPGTYEVTLTVTNTASDTTRITKTVVVKR